MTTSYSVFSNLNGFDANLAIYSWLSGFHAGCLTFSTGTVRTITDFSSSSGSFPCKDLTVYPYLHTAEMINGFWATFFTKLKPMIFGPQKRFVDA